MTTGIGKYHLDMMEIKKDKLVEFVSSHEPVTYAEILKNAHVRRKNLRVRLDELEQEKKLMKTNAGTYIIFNEVNLSNFNYLYKLQELVECQEQNLKELLKAAKKIDAVCESQPIRYCLALAKSELNELGYHKHEFTIVDPKISSWKVCRCNSLLIDGKIYSPTPRNEIAKILFTSKKLGIQLKDDSERIREFLIHFRMYPRIEYPRLKDKWEIDEKFCPHMDFIEKDGSVNHGKMLQCYESGYQHKDHKNPLGIHRNFIKKDGSIDYDKIERVYHNRREMGSWHMKCSSCGNEESVYVADEMNAMIEKRIRRLWHYKCSSCEKVTHVDILGELYEMFERLEKGEEIELKCNFR